MTVDPIMAKKLKEHQLLLVNNFAQYKGAKKDYCVQNNVNYRTFINWDNKLSVEV